MGGLLTHRKSKISKLEGRILNASLGCLVPPGTNICVANRIVRWNHNLVATVSIAGEASPTTGASSRRLRGEGELLAASESLPMSTAVGSACRLLLNLRLFVAKTLRRGRPPRWTP